MRDLDRQRRDVYVEAKANGFNTRAIKTVARQNPEQAQSDAADLEAYLKALGGAVLVQRLGKEDFGAILFGTSRYPSEMVDLGDLDVPDGSAL
jgi:hypothetical protein